jgi:hypothetical protein
MSKLKKLVLVTAALGALAVGGAAFAGAQGAGTAAKVTVQQPNAEVSTPGDPADSVQAGEDRPESPSDQPDGPGDREDGNE